jgi:hypothetical protein
VPVAGIDPYAWKGYEAPPQRFHLRMCKAIEERQAALLAEKQEVAD